ncbi:hypothetical protein HOP50_17g80390 [Chloropicon primus]|uniref:Uncharacterized protein n=1 Tax=Chloropicon primus TaxID=1764295 RepID=A0A5B8MY75_9CHLO|nr:hypothetical protein A3770_17p80150 [Chloropicon primus]UPR04694.1 hypothetical protein HOP50_17g80390 [Chloropicon primus]|eukprot:QDZ25497.1 hypothetical protein A3770_17p80150 [Chloropicon primus]
MVKVKLPDIRKNKLSVIIKSLEKRDAALQKFQRRDLYNSKSVKVVENTQIELYLPGFSSEKGKPTWNGSTHLDERKVNEGKGKTGAGREGKEHKQGDEGKRGNFKKGNATTDKGAGNGKVVMGRKISSKRPLLTTNGMKTLRIDDGLGPFTVRTSKDKDQGVATSKIEMVFKPTQTLVSKKSRFSTTKTNMLSLKSWNQNNPTENACHWLSSGAGDLDQVQLIKTSLESKAASNARSRLYDNGLTTSSSTEKYTVSMVKPSLPQVSTSPPHSQQILEQLLQQQQQQQQSNDKGQDTFLDPIAYKNVDVLSLKTGSGGLHSQSQSDSGSPTRIGMGGDGDLGNGIANAFSHHQRAYHHGEFSSYRDNSHIQGNINQNHVRSGKGGQSLIEAPFIVKHVSKDGTTTILTSPGISPQKPQGSLGIRGSSPIKSPAKSPSPKKGMNGLPHTKSPNYSSPSLPPVDKNSNNNHAKPSPSAGPPSIGIFMPHRSTESGQEEDTTTSPSSNNNLEVSQLELIDSVSWLHSKSAIATSRKKQQESLKKRYSGGGSDSGGSPNFRKPMSSPNSITGNYGQRTTRHGMIPERTSKAVLYPLHLSAKAPVFRERAIKGLSIAPNKPAAES